MGNEDILWLNVTMNHTCLVNVIQNLQNPINDYFVKNIIFTQLSPEWLYYQCITVRTEGWTIMPSDDCDDGIVLSWTVSLDSWFQPQIRRNRLKYPFSWDLETTVEWSSRARSEAEETYIICDKDTPSYRNTNHGMETTRSGRKGDAFISNPISWMKHSSYLAVIKRMNNYWAIPSTPRNNKPIKISRRAAKILSIPFSYNINSKWHDHNSNSLKNK